MINITAKWRDYARQFLRASCAQMRCGCTLFAVTLKHPCRTQTVLTYCSHGEKALRWGRIALLAQHECLCRTLIIFFKIQFIFIKTELTSHSEIRNFQLKFEIVSLKTVLQCNHSALMACQECDFPI